MVLKKVVEDSDKKLFHTDILLNLDCAINQFHL